MARKLGTAPGRERVNSGPDSVFGVGYRISSPTLVTSITNYQDLVYYVIIVASGHGHLKKFGSTDSQHCSY